MTPTNEQYIQAFNSKVRRKQFEQFSVLLCDLHTSNSQQKKLLQTVLFAEEHSPVNWLDYINYVNVLFPTRKLQLFRLVNKAIECIDEDKYRNNKQYLLLHLAVIRFKQDSADGLKYFENVIWKRKVGVRFAQLYTSWAELASSVNCEIEDILLILERGISYRAEPLHTLITRIQNLKQQLTNPIMESEVGISSNSHETQFLFSKKRYQTDFDVESASAKPPNHESKRSRCDDDSVTCSLDTKCCSATNISAVDEYITHTSEVVGATVIAPVLQVEENLESENAQQPTPSASVDYITVGKRQFIKLGILGQGGSSTVYRVLSPKTGSLYALKKIKTDFNQDNYASEISILQKLKGSQYVIDLIGVSSSADNTISMLLEMGDIDLAKILSNRFKIDSAKSSAAQPFVNPFFARSTWKDMLTAVNFIHEKRIIHCDLKPANFVWVRGLLKLIDFGIAIVLNEDSDTMIRQSQIGTINYMCPEAISGEQATENKEPGTSDRMRLSVSKASDIWSLGCILYQIIYGKPPFAHLNTLKKLQCISDTSYSIPYPTHDDEDALESIKACLQRNPKSRATIDGSSGLLGMKYLRLSSNRYANFSQNAAATKSLVQHSHVNSNSSNSPRSISRAPLKSLESNLKREIHTITSTQLKPDSRREKWIRPKIAEAKTDIRSVLEKRFGEMRTYLVSQRDDTEGDYSETLL